MSAKAATRRVLAELAGAAAPAPPRYAPRPPPPPRRLHPGGTTMVADGAPGALAAATVARLDLATTAAPIPASACSTWSPSCPTTRAARPRPTSPGAIELRDDFARWLGAELGRARLPLRAAPERPRPAAAPGQAACLRGGASDLSPDFGPAAADPPAGATAVGARPVLVAYNVWVSSLAVARMVRHGSGPATCVRSAWPSANGPRSRATWSIPPRSGRPSSTTPCAAASPRSAAAWRRRVGRSRARVVLERFRAGAGPSSACRTRTPSRHVSSAGRARTGPGDPRDGADDVPAGQGPGPAQPAALPFAHPTPDAELLAVGQGVLEAVLAHDAAPADLLRFSGRRSPLGEEQSGSTPMQFACTCQLRSWRP